MIICHRHRFIFIKTRKTAGSSLEIGLSRVCGPEDIITPLSAHLGEEDIRKKEGGTGPCNYFKPVREHRGFKEWRRLILRGQRARYGQHCTAQEVRHMAGENIWSTYYRFTVERNPWDRAISRYWWQKYRWEVKGRSNFPGLSEYLQWLKRYKPHFLSNWHHYTINNEIAVDRVLRYENLKEELEQLRTELGIKGDISLPAQRAKGNFRQSRLPYNEVLSQDDRELIERLCWREIEAFGYHF